jgi:hypothetical protein
VAIRSRSHTYQIDEPPTSQNSVNAKFAEFPFYTLG